MSRQRYFRLCHIPAFYGYLLIVALSSSCLFSVSRFRYLYIETLPRSAVGAIHVVDVCADAFSWPRRVRWHSSVCSSLSSRLLRKGHACRQVCAGRSKAPYGSTTPSCKQLVSFHSVSSAIYYILVTSDPSQLLSAVSWLIHIRICRRNEKAHVP